MSDPARPFFASPAGVLAVSLCIVLFVLCAFSGFYHLFSNFRPYDDEGILLMASRMFVDGARFYTDTLWIYGPGHLAMMSLLHEWLGVPVTHSAARFVTLTYWMMLCGLSSLLVYRLSESIAWSMVTFLGVFLYTTSIVNEPGHPQALLAALAISVPLVASCLSASCRRPGWFVIGALVGGILSVKVNAGMFALAAALVILFGSADTGKWRVSLKLLLVAGSLLSPFLLMAPLLSEPGCIQFAALASLAAGAVAISIRPVQPAAENGYALLMLSLGVLSVTLASLMFALAHGAGPGDILASLLSYTGSQSSFYHFFRDYSLLQLVGAALSLFAATWACYSPHEDTRTRIVVIAKVYLVAVTVYVLVTDGPASSHALFGYGGPWSWLLMMGGRHPLARCLLAATAAWSPLLAYPIPGSQIYFGCVPLLALALVCAADLAGVAHQRSESAGPIVGWGLKRIPTALMLFSVLVGATQLTRASAQYNALQPLGLPGTRFIRLTPEQGGTYRKVVKELNKSDVALTTFRFNSFYLWSSTEMAGTLYHAHSLAYALPAEQERIKADLQRAERPLVVVRRAPGWAEEPDSEMLAWIDANFQPYRKIGKYSLLMRRQSAANDDRND